MLATFKRLLYFPIASYFLFFARIRLWRWRPRIIVITGSNGKTTTLHLVEAQLRTGVVFSHHANSSFGIPFDILGLHRQTLRKVEWIWLFLKAPVCLFAPLPKEKIYIVEADCDRPGEGKFLARFLRPEVVLWVSVSHTHTLQFDSLMDKGIFQTVDEAVAYEFGYFIEYCQKLVVVNGDEPLLVAQLKRTKAVIKQVKKSEMLSFYGITKDSTEFIIEKKKIRFSALVPEELFYGIAMSRLLVSYLGTPFDETFSQFRLPPGRSSLFAGIKETMIVDSCYNANLASMKAMLSMYEKYPSKKKWAVIGDMLEQGKDERREHEQLALVLEKMDLARIIFLGPRVQRYTYPLLLAAQQSGKKEAALVAFLQPKDVLEYLEHNIAGGEAIFFKGARFMEGVIAHLLLHPEDTAKLSRREKVWDIRRKQWGL